MEMIIIYAIVFLIIYVIVNAYSSNQQEEKEDAARKEKSKLAAEEAQRQAKIRLEREEAQRQAKFRRDREEAERIRREREIERISKENEDLKFEIVTVLSAKVDKNGKPKAIIKRKNNTYAFIEKASGVFNLGTLKLSRDTTSRLVWVDSDEYERRTAVEQRKEIQQGILLKSRLARRFDEENSRKVEKAEIERQRRIRLENLLVKKQNWADFQLVLHQNNIRQLYHFTDQENIASIIANGGLFSWHYCSENAITIANPGGDTLSRNLDMRYSLQDYVRVSFVRNHPMMYVAHKEERIKVPVVLTISLDVCYFRETRFANMNATRTGHNQGDDLESLMAIHFSTVQQQNHFNLDELEKPFFQAEVLVKTWIPLSHITNINNLRQ